VTPGEQAILSWQRDVNRSRELLDPDPDLETKASVRGYERAQT
jgi:hypothetical protein